MYCIDTSSLIAAWYERYPPDVFPPFWDKFEELITTGRIISPSPVLNEIEKRSDELHKWLRDRNAMFHPLDEKVQLRARAVLERFPRLVGQKKNRYSADPFVIALALETEMILITEENPSGNDNKPNIPDVCSNDGFRKEYSNLLGFIRNEKWVFT